MPRHMPGILGQMPDILVVMGSMNHWRRGSLYISFENKTKPSLHWVLSLTMSMISDLSSFCEKIICEMREYFIYFYSFIKIKFKDIIIDESLNQ